MPIHLFLSLILGASIIFAAFLTWQESTITISSPIPARTSHLSHATILISGNAGFTNASGVVWGSGNASDPYIIERWDIDASTATGIWVEDSTCSFVIRDVNVSNGLWITAGIYLRNVTNGTISNCTCWQNAIGIDLDSSFGNLIVNNTCSSTSWVGIYLLESDNNRVINNSCPSNSEWGISLQYCRNVFLENNSMTDCGLEIFSNHQADWISHTLGVSNTVNDKPILYLRNQTGGTAALGAGQVILVNCRDMLVQDQHCDGGGNGVSVAFSTNITVRNNSCTSDMNGINLESSSGCLIVDNVCSSNAEFGIFADLSHGIEFLNNTCTNNVNVGIYIYSSWGNWVRNNTVSSSTFDGVALFQSDFNIVTGNLLSDNGDYGAHIIASDRNTVWNNTFLGNNGASATYDPNHIQAYCDGTGNWWNSSDGFGNYWGDWTTPDNDLNGIVDSPYNISGTPGGWDYYPRTTAMTPIPEFGSGITTICAALAIMATLICLRRSSSRRV
jgi:parallel beta-helix repeat protein